MNPYNVVNALLDIVKVNIDLYPSKITPKEKELAQHLYETIKSFVDCTKFNYQEETTLDLHDMSDYSDNDEDMDTVYNDRNEVDDEWTNEADGKATRHLKQYSLEYMKAVVDFADEKDAYGKKRHTWKSIHNRFKSLLSQSYVSLFRNYLQKEGTKQQKCREIDKLIYDKFVSARDQALPIHNLDLQRWALKFAKEMKLDNFHASHGWLSNFKRKHGIVSRRITNIVTRHEIDDYRIVQQSKQYFLTEYYNSLPDYDPSEVINTDQSGVEKELHSTRTLSAVGLKKIYGIVSSKNATTHSYTIQPSISLDGKVVDPILLCLQEVNGKMGDTVKKNLFKPANVVITCSSSGKLTTSLVAYWRDKCLLPFIGKKCLLLSDSWAGQKDIKLYENKTCLGKDVVRLEIPKRTTSELQLLDCFYNRQVKNFIKKIYNRVALDKIPIHLYERNNISKLVSLMHNQLSASVFQPMVKYSWFVAGLLKQNPSPFSTINEICFPTITSHEQCELQSCGECVYITCAHCSKKLCFQHFFISYHFHT
ncbi:unnamed protein product [Adineta ricciae]|uniref:HTH CENPB-type domain-containing protein n=1 Tax=Adineta ricciae TaxID=249248 RepID=A0A815WG05_ADIRI|nr:unnamed protein product [Adineta ricciae]CAF1582220.1 unnamed protein product [Adineta ricciae]